jgi:hypothetical protein
MSMPARGSHADPVAGLNRGIGGALDGNSRTQLELDMGQHLVAQILDMGHRTREPVRIAGIEDQMLRANAEEGAAGADRAVPAADQAVASLTCVTMTFIHGEKRTGSVL